MSQQLIDHSPDLKRLRNDGFEIEVKGGYLIIHHIPYVNHSRDVKYGKLISELTLSSNTSTAKPGNHIIHFMGEQPCNIDGSVISQIIHANPNQVLQDGLVINYSFSNKPVSGYGDYYQKVTTYTRIITAPAKIIDKNVTEKTFKVVIDENPDSVFNYLDTNSSRANIDKLNSIFSNQKIAIIGLGGTGAYILDFVAKTPVQEIHIYDGDEFLLHNAFRSPGAPSIEELDNRKLKTDYYASIYSKMHKKVISHPYYINELSIVELSNYTFVFLAIDKDAVKRSIIDQLLKVGISFIDVGLGVNIANENLIGTVRVTAGTPDKFDHLYKRISCGDNGNNEYDSNIQIADLNALNALFAVIKWKKILGFYQDLIYEHHLTYSINNSYLANDDFTT